MSSLFNFLDKSRQLTKKKVRFQIAITPLIFLQVALKINFFTNMTLLKMVAFNLKF